MTLLSRGAELTGLPQAQAFGLMNAGWATGAILGPALGGALGQAVGDPLAYGLGAVACAGTFLAVSRWHSPAPSASPALLEP